MKAGIAAKADPHVKLHVTLLNSTYRKSTDRSGPKTPFDASKLLVDFANFDFGEARIATVDLSERGKFDENGFYHQVASLRLP